MTPSFTSENSKVPDLFYFVDEFKLIFKFLLNSYDVFLNFNTDINYLQADFICCFHVCN
ncbi:hypothetical protein HanXRQr2_Chr12g0558451 [Helianthus annuus]|uniref:Uncharacterized protein n=1 Tax=Helianthus annuus TaxID=4232 RepID=A0A251T4A0_HELAN|nr:hypothetical protein HanXRQr2_Chr12g0558451 [Helianthus annuus]KAJ0864085.1 hypothetical protein HanPSC8_Chr12g0537621 [Helianthus annuus]